MVVFQPHSFSGGKGLSAGIAVKVSLLLVSGLFHLKIHNFSDAPEPNQSGGVEIGNRDFPCPRSYRQGDGHVFRTSSSRECILWSNGWYYCTGILTPVVTFASQPFLKESGSLAC
ncbi:hypothetical protein GDO81_027618 [Engystomops pustulosus]|uniref:Uncharacterized protein n=1 Tax=Engystomops pustulosus TaxID=76066 RepID=A0AAV6ZEF6_ENGPU|nr:hypothetical protein GDO81_027618 [Engystomops pustulosus]